MARKPIKKRIRKGPRPPKRGFRVDYKYVAIILGCAAVLGAGVYLYLTSRAAGIRVGENLTYGVYIGNNKIGLLTSQITGTESSGNVEYYVALDVLVINDAVRTSKLWFDKEGNLKGAMISERVVDVENDSRKWETTIDYSLADNQMRVRVKDNRNPENYYENDDNVDLTAEIMVPEHVWYLFRFESLHLGYRREFFINVLPEGVRYIVAAVEVVGEESVEIHAGSFDCWVIEVENAQLDTAWASQVGRLTTWPIYKLWVAKSEGVVVKAWQNDTPIVYELEIYE